MRRIGWPPPAGRHGPGTARDGGPAPPGGDAAHRRGQPPADHDGRAAARGGGAPGRPGDPAPRAAALARTVRASPAGQATAHLLRTIPGIGPVVARTLLAPVPALGPLTRQEAAVRGGLAPRTRDRGDPARRACFERLVQHGTPAKVALVAGMRTLLAVANAILRDGVPWRPQGGTVA